MGDEGKAVGMVPKPRRLCCLSWSMTVPVSQCRHRSRWRKLES